MNGFNLSEWALRHRSYLWYFIVVFSIMGAVAYLGLGRQEDPDFTIKTMVISAQWPGATVEDTLNQVTDRIEKELEEVEQFDFARSLTKPGEATIFVNLKDNTKARDVPAIWAKSETWSATSRRSCRPGSSGRNSTTTLATSSATSMRSRRTACRKGSCATTPKPPAPKSCACPTPARSNSSAPRTKPSTSNSRAARSQGSGWTAPP